MPKDSSSVHKVRMTYSPHYSIYAKGSSTAHTPVIGFASDSTDHCSAALQVRPAPRALGTMSIPVRVFLEAAWKKNLFALERPF
jgi:hypothetical protein